MRFLYFLPIGLFSIFCWSTDSVSPFDLEEMPLKRQKIDSDKDNQKDENQIKNIQEDAKQMKTKESFSLDSDRYGKLNSNVMAHYNKKCAEYQKKGNYMKAAEYSIKAIWGGDTDELTYVENHYADQLGENEDLLDRFQKKDKAYFESLVPYLAEELKKENKNR